jgi:hypothetical protein
MRSLNGANGGDAMPDTGARWVAVNAISSAENDLERDQKQLAPSDGKSATLTGQPVANPSAREYASVAPQLMNPVDDDQPTRLWEPSQVIVISEHLSPRKEEILANARNLSLGQPGVVKKITPPPLPPVAAKKGNEPQRAGGPVRTAAVTPRRGAEKVIPPPPRIAVAKGNVTANASGPAHAIAFKPRPQPSAKEPPRRLIRNAAVYPFDPVAQPSRALVSSVKIASSTEQSTRENGHGSDQPAKIATVKPSVPALPAKIATIVATGISGQPIPNLPNRQNAKILRDEIDRPASTSSSPRQPSSIPNPPVIVAPVKVVVAASSSPRQQPVIPNPPASVLVASISAHPRDEIPESRIARNTAERPSHSESASRVSPRLPSAATRARPAGSAPTPRTSRHRLKADELRARLQNSSRPKGVPAQRPVAAAVKFPDIPATRSFRREAIPAQRPVAAAVKFPDIPATRSLAWVWNTLAVAGIIILVLTVRYVISVPRLELPEEPAAAASATAPSGTERVQTQVEAARSSAPSELATGSAVGPVTAAPAQARRPMQPIVNRAEEEAPAKTRSIPVRTVHPPRLHRAAAPISVTSKARPTSARNGHFSPAKSAKSHTAQTDQQWDTGSQTTRPLIASLSLDRTIKVGLVATLTPIGFWTRR